MRIFHRPEPSPQAAAGEQAGRPETPVLDNRRRRGATAMEYLVMASFIICVLIVTIQYIGSLVSASFNNSAEATSK